MRTLSNDYKIFTGIDIENKKIVDEEKAFTFKKLYDYDWKQHKRKSFYGKKNSLIYKLY